MSDAHIFEYHKRFPEGREQAADDERHTRHATAKNEGKVLQITEISDHRPPDVLNKIRT